MSFGDEFWAELLASVAASLVMVPFFYKVYNRWIRYPCLSIQVLSTGRTETAEEPAYETVRLSITNKGKTVFSAAEIQFTVWASTNIHLRWRVQANTTWEVLTRSSGEEHRGELTRNLYPGATEDFGEFDVRPGGRGQANCLISTPRGMFPKSTNNIGDHVEQLKRGFRVFNSTANGIEFGSGLNSSGQESLRDRIGNFF